MSSKRRNALRLAGTGVRLAGGGGLTFLLRDDFTTTEAAPLASPRTAEPGPGTLTITDSDGNKVSITNGKLRLSGIKTTNVEPRVFFDDAVTRAAGRAAVFRLNGASNTCTVRVGLRNDKTASPTIHAFSLVSGGALMAMANSVTVQQINTTINTDYTLGVVLRATGALYLVKGGVFADWSLYWVDAAVTTATLYAGHGVGNQMGSTMDMDFLRVLDLPAPFDTDFGLATQRLAGARSAGDTVTHTANCLLEFVATTVPSAGQIEVRLRAQDASNYWQVTVDSSGNLDLDEVVAGVVTQRGTSAGVIANGDRIVVIADGSTIRVYEANTLRITYTSATNFATATSAKLETLGTGGAVSNIIAYPRTLTGTAASLLDQAVA